MRALFLLCLLTLGVGSRAWGDDDDLPSEHDHDHHDHDHDHDHAREDFSTVTCGSSVKLQHKGSNYRLHSHNIKWGSGSQQQSVTLFPTGGDPNSLWQIQSALGETACAIGTPITCGMKIRFFHVSTRHWLHSHLHRSPVSGRQEISAYGDNGDSDTGDNWIAQCGGDSANNGQRAWKRAEAVALVHVDTGKRLYARRADAFDNNNCRGCPIIGQLEVSAHDTKSGDVNALWTTEDGFYFPVLKPETN